MGSKREGFIRRILCRMSQPRVIGGKPALIVAERFSLKRQYARRAQFQKLFCRWPNPRRRLPNPAPKVA
jgi:hypothetical protein